ncbi:MAG: putative aminohydrolase SsnA [Anaerolineales bacterium]|nr:putative aminohydrolase SsnA [Anaerolineales bacterium]
MLITNGTVITFGKENRFIENGAVRIEGALITAVGEKAKLEQAYPNDEVVDAGGRLIMPGNICAHTHFYGAFARGMAIPGDPPRDFPEILGKLWWRLDKALLEMDVKYSALVCLVDAIKHGTTTLIDHHASPSAVNGSLDYIADAVQQAGLRASLCYEVTDRNGPEEAQAGIDENVRFLHAVRDMRGVSGQGEADLLAASFGLHASLTLSDETLADCVEAAQGLDTGFHIHAAEGISDQEDSVRKSGKRVVERLNGAGILGPKSILVHCVHVDAWEMEILRDTKTWVTHQPRSNMNNAVGVAAVETMLRGGIPVGMGNDGFSNNMWAEWKMTYLVHKLWHRDPRRANGYDIMQMAVTNNAALAKTFWPKAPLGELAAGVYADLILVDYHPFTELTAGNLPWHILFGFEASAVHSTMVAGKWLMRDRKLLTLDEAAIAAKARELSAGVWQRCNEF